jgi:hypothetical protein
MRGNKMSNQRDLVLGGLAVATLASVAWFFGANEKPSRKNPRGRRLPSKNDLLRNLEDKDFNSFYELAGRYGIAIPRLFKMFADYDIDLATTNLSRQSLEYPNRKQEVSRMHYGPLDHVMQGHFGLEDPPYILEIEPKPNRLQLERDFAFGMDASKIATKYKKTVPEIQKMAASYGICYFGDL